MDTAEVERTSPMGQLLQMCAPVNHLEFHVMKFSIKMKKSKLEELTHKPFIPPVLISFSEDDYSERNDNERTGK